MSIEKVDEILTKAEVFYLSTVDGEKPKVRPLGFHLLYEDKIYFGVGTFKEVYKQLVANPNIEIIASTPSLWMRLDGKAVFDHDDYLVDECFKIMPPIGKLYKENGWEMGIFHIENVRGEFKQIMNVKETFEW